MIKPFEVIVFQLFLDMLRASGMGLGTQQIDKLRAASLEFSEAFKAEAKLACLEHMKEFQANVKEAMAELEAKVAVPRYMGNDVDLIKIVGSNAETVVVKPRG